MDEQRPQIQPLPPHSAGGSSHRSPTSFTYPMKRVLSTPSAAPAVSSDGHSPSAVHDHAAPGSLKSVPSSGSILARLVSVRTSSDNEEHHRNQYHSQGMSFHLPSASILEAIPASRSGGGLVGAGSADEMKLAKIHRFPMNADDETHNGAPLIDSLSPRRRQLLADCLELFSGRVSKEILERSWTPDAMFENPLVRCQGYQQYSAHWFSVPRSRVIRIWVLPSRSPSELRWEQVQEHHSRLHKIDKIIHSIVVLELDNEDRIVKMQDLWDGKKLSSGIRALFRKVNGKIVSEFSGKPPKD